MTYTAGAPVSKAQAKSPTSQEVRTGRPATDWVPVGSSSRTTYTGRIPLASCARTTSPAETGGTGGRLPSNRSRDKRGIVTPSCRIALRRGLRVSLSPNRGGPQNTSAPPRAFGRPETCPDGALGRRQGLRRPHKAFGAAAIRAPLPGLPCTFKRSKIQIGITLTISAFPGKRSEACARFDRPCLYRSIPGFDASRANLS